MPLRREALGFPWVTRDPFLFCVHHLDLYPSGNAAMGPTGPLTGRNIGMDFTIKDGWRMYHGERVPGFPAHPHRGFETITLARRGFIDHSDSMGAAARFGEGDVQWMTAGRGIMHSEMFPLRRTDQDNPVELFQIWLNLPARNKMVDPHFSMFWSDAMPRKSYGEPGQPQTNVVAMVGSIDGLSGVKPPPKSWAAESTAEVAIWTIDMEPNAWFELPAASPGVNRTLYFFDGDSVEVAGEAVSDHVALHFDRAEACVVANRGAMRAQLLMMQGRPIGEPVVQHGPFVMNTREEIVQAVTDYQRTRFGGWPWPSNEPVHAREDGRFARHADGKLEHP